MSRPRRSVPIPFALAALIAGCAGGGDRTQPSTSGSISPAARTTSPEATSPATIPPLASPIPSPGSAATAPEQPNVDDLAWQPLDASAGPAAREDHTWTVDRAGERAYLFGGRAGEPFGDLWAYDLATGGWSQLGPIGPAPAARFGHEAVWVDGIGLVIFAGQAGTSFYNDLWAYDPDANSWRQLPSAGAVPVARYGTCSGLSADGRLWISHGFTSDGVRFADTRAYDFGAGTWSDVTPTGDVPVSRCLHACWWTDAGAFILYAGQTTGVTALGDLWRLESPGTDQATWHRNGGGRLPAERNLPAVSRWSAGTIAFGGQAVDGGFLDDAWYLPDDGEPLALDPATLDPRPPERSGAALITDSERGRLLLFGGRNGVGALADLWELSADGG